MVPHVPIMIGLWNLCMDQNSYPRIPDRIHPNLIGKTRLIGFGFFPISKYVYGAGNGDIDTHFKPVLNVVNY